MELIRFVEMKLRGYHMLLLAIIAGLFMGFSFPFTGGIFPLAFVMFIPLLVINFQLNKVAKKGRIFIRFGLNYLSFVIFNAITCWWIYYASEGGVYMAVLANSLLMTLPFGIASFIGRQLGEGKGLLSLLVLWLGFEHVHYYWELSWPWLNFGNVFGTYPKLIQWYEFVGVAGGSLWIISVNIVAYIIFRNVWLRKESIKVQTPNIIFFVCSLFLPIGSSLLIYGQYEEVIDPVDIVIVQPNIEANTEKFVLSSDFQLNKMFGVAQQEITSETDLVVCPETAIPYGMNEKEMEYQPSILMIDSFLTANHSVPIMIGADTYGFFDTKASVACRPYGNLWYESYNTALMIENDHPLEVYHKAKLVLGGEKLPFIQYFPFFEKYSVELGGTQGLLGIGEEPMVFEAKGVSYAPLICYESVYGDYTSLFVRKGAEILCVITNDGWWRDTPGYKQHRMFSQIRAIENRRSLARSANTGISCFIDQRGEIISELGWNEYGTLHETINRNTEFTFFTKYGSIVGRIACFLSLAMMLYGITTRLKKMNIFPKKISSK